MTLAHRLVGMGAATDVVAPVLGEPYPWPYDGRLDAARLGLFIVAAQASLAETCETAPTVLARIDELTVAASHHGVRVIRSRHFAPAALRRPCGLPPLIGDPLVPAQGRNDTVVDAYGFDGFFGNPLAGQLTRMGVTHLLVCGLFLEGPVHSTLRSANDRGLECLLITDACAPADLRLADAAISMIHMSGGIFGATATSAEVIASLSSAVSTS